MTVWSVTLAPYAAHPSLAPVRAGMGPHSAPESRSLTFPLPETGPWRFKGRILTVCKRVNTASRPLSVER